MPLPREEEFCIDLAPKATPISKVPYRMALVELKELNTWLDELLEKGYIRPKHILLGAPEKELNKLTVKNR